MWDTDMHTQDGDCESCISDASDMSAVAGPTDISTIVTLERLLILGTDGDSEASKLEHLRTALHPVLDKIVAEGDAPDIVVTVKEVSGAKRASRPDAFLYALAYCTRCVHEGVRSSALEAITSVCTTPAMLYQFVEFVKHAKGDVGRGGRCHGRGFRRAVSRWFTDQDAYSLAFTMTKGGRRHNWSAKDMLRVAHVRPKKCSPATALVLKFIVKGTEGLDTSEPESKSDSTPEVKRVRDFLVDYAVVKTATPADADKVVELMRRHNLAREHLPLSLLALPAVWAALVERMPFTALVKSLGTLAKHELLTKGSATGTYVASRLRDGVALRRAGLHPLTVLVALNQYREGTGLRGSGQWEVQPHIVDALNDTLSLAFAQTERFDADFSIMIGLDVSGSMQSNLPCLQLSMRDAAAALTATILRQTTASTVMAFSQGGMILDLDSTATYLDVQTKTENMGFERTNCALPVIRATELRIKVGAFVIITDNDTNVGSVSCGDALRAYNCEMGLYGEKRAKFVVISMEACTFSIAEAGNPDMLDVCGFDTQTQARIFDFIRGKPTEKE